MAPASFPKGRHGSVDAFTNCAWPCHCSAFLGPTEPVVQHMWKKNIKPHLLRNIWTPSIEKYLNHSESKFGSLYVLNVTNLGPFTVLYFFFKTSLNQLWHHHSIAEWQGQQVANVVAHLGKSGHLWKSPGILLDSDHSQHATKVGFGWWMIGEWAPNESSAKSYHVISRLPII